MWWRSQTDPETANTVFRLADYFQTPGQTIPDVHGVGSTVDEEGRRVPLLVLDEALDPDYLNIEKRLLKWRWRGLIFAGGDPKNERSRLFVPLHRAGPQVERLLENWNVPRNTRIFFSAPPEPLDAGPGARIWAERRDATLGFRVRVGNRTVFSTAGHLVRALPCTIVKHSRSLLGEDRIEGIGSVKFWNDPKPPLALAGIGGVDVAIVEPDGNHTNGPDSEAILANPPDVPDQASVILFGAKSPNRRGWIDGALQATRALDGRIWKNCWSVVGGHGGFAKRGDSGGPVVIDGGVVLGHLVCALGMKFWTGRFQCGLVQDIHSIVDYVESKYGASPTILQPGFKV
jgi:hypothetical protein